MKYVVQTNLNPKIHCETKHLKTGKSFTTDVPTSIGGTGESFAPVEALCGALCSCMLSMLQYMANTRGVAIPHASAVAYPTEENHKVKSIEVRISVPGEEEVSEDLQKVLEDAVDHCPVRSALSSDIIVTMIWDWQ